MLILDMNISRIIYELTNYYKHQYECSIFDIKLSFYQNCTHWPIIYLNCVEKVISLVIRSHLRCNR